MPSAVTLTFTVAARYSQCYSFTHGSWQQYLTPILGLPNGHPAALPNSTVVLKSSQQCPFCAPSHLSESFFTVTVNSGLPLLAQKREIWMLPRNGPPASRNTSNDCRPRRGTRALHSTTTTQYMASRTVYSTVVLSTCTYIASGLTVVVVGSLYFEGLI